MKAASKSKPEQTTAARRPASENELPGYVVERNRIALAAGL